MNTKQISMTSIFECLSDEAKAEAKEYLEQLFMRDRQRRAEKAQKAFERMHELIRDDLDWETEEDVIADLAAFRREWERA